jgi:CRISPR type III-A-associated protein Csm2
MNDGHQGQQRGGGDRREAARSVDVGWVAEVIEKPNYPKLDTEAHGVALRLSDATKTQVRGIFGTVKRLESLKGESLKRELVLLRPRLAYAAARVNGLEELKTVLTEASKRAEEKLDERVPRLIDLMEAILCYSTAQRSHQEKTR